MWKSEEHITSHFKPKTQLKMFVWYPDVLRDHTSGMLVVHATSVSSAISLAVRRMYPNAADDSCTTCQFAFQKAKELRAELKSKKPLIISRTGIAFVYGGG